MKYLNGVFFTMGLVLGITTLPSWAEEQPAQPVATRVLPREVAFDTNKDGKPDRWEHYRPDGKLEKVEADTNGDGKIDEIGYAEDGKLVRSEKDSDYDGVMDQWAEY